MKTWNEAASELQAEFFLLCNRTKININISTNFIISTSINISINISIYTNINIDH